MKTTSQARGRVSGDAPFRVYDAGGAPRGYLRSDVEGAGARDEYSVRVGDSARLSAFAGYQPVGGEGKGASVRCLDAVFRLERTGDERLSLRFKESHDARGAEGLGR
jgi:hypothetical protein